jgi:hypothetical protein
VLVVVPVVVVVYPIPVVADASIFAVIVLFIKSISSN